MFCDQPSYKCGNRIVLAVWAFIVIFAVSCGLLVEDEGTKKQPVPAPPNVEVSDHIKEIEKFIQKEEIPLEAKEAFEEQKALCGDDVFLPLECADESDNLIESRNIDCPKLDASGNYAPTAKGCRYRINVKGKFQEREVIKTGLLTREDDYYKAVYAQPSAADLAAVDDKWDLRNFGAVAQVPVKEQKCGDCWAQATVMNLIFSIAAWDKKVEDLSIQYHISRCKTTNHGTCGGGYMSAADAILATGQPFETQDPYQGRNSSCAFTDDELGKGFNYHIESAPYVGSSLQYSRFFHEGRNGGRSGAKVEAIKAMMQKYRSGGVTTILAISSSGGTINSCSGINSPGNHMQVIIGWGYDGDPNVVDVRNSWGTNHGNNGVTRMVWECGEGRLNRGVGRDVRVYEYKNCEFPANPYIERPKETFVKDTPQKGVWIGRKGEHGQTCKVTPMEGVTRQSSDGCEFFASPDRSVEYHITAYQKDCDDTKSAMVLVQPLVPGRRSNVLVTPHGETTWKF